MRVEETVWIPLADGCRLAARIWFPDEATLPAPVVLEYLPYRRRDRHRGDDALLHPGLASRGFVAVRVDIRGSGDSDGILLDEYTAQEGADALEVIDWLSRQPWSNGSVGMIGLSWSGFNSLRVAALRPPALKAIVTACASDDRYADDMHYMGGCLLHDNLQYGATLFTWLATPPDPEVVGDRWRQMWSDRLEAVEPPAGRWMSHPTNDAYWRCRCAGCLGRPHRRRGDGGRRLGRRVHERRAQAPLDVDRAAQGVDRALGPCVPASRNAGAAHRLHRRCRSLVRSLASRCRHGRDGRADADRMAAGERATPNALREPDRPLAHGTRLAEPGGHSHRASPRRHATRGGARADRPLDLLPGGHRSRLRRMVPIRCGRRASLRSARRR